jgi:hypothetical protein
MLDPDLAPTPSCLEKNTPLGRSRSHCIKRLHSRLGIELTPREFAAVERWLLYIAHCRLHKRRKRAPEGAFSIVTFLGTRERRYRIVLVITENPLRVATLWPIVREIPPHWEVRWYSIPRSSQMYWGTRRAEDKLRRQLAAGLDKPTQCERLGPATLLELLTSWEAQRLHRNGAGSQPAVKRFMCKLVCRIPRRPLDQRPG